MVAFTRRYRLVLIVSLAACLAILALLLPHLRPSALALVTHSFRQPPLTSAHPRNFAQTPPPLSKATPTLSKATQAPTMSVQTKVDKHISEGHIVVFSKSYCPYCRKAKALLQSLNEKPTVFELDQMGEEGTAWQSYLADKTGQRTVPSVFIDGKFVGGSSDLENAHHSGELQKLLSA